MKNKCVVVSGVSSSLGEAIRHHVEGLGFCVAGISRSPADLHHRKFRGDVTNYVSCEAAVSDIVSHCGPIYGVVACAGLTSSKLLVQTSEEELEQLLKVNVMGTLNLIKAALKRGQMVKEHSGSVVCVGSSVGLEGNAGQVGYAASKAALGGAVKSLCKEYGRFGIRFNTIHPGLIENTGMANALSEEQRKHFKESCCLGRAARAEEVADAVGFFLRNSYVNGASLELHGGKR